MTPTNYANVKNLVRLYVGKLSKGSAMASYLWILALEELLQVEETPMLLHVCIFLEVFKR